MNKKYPNKIEAEKIWQEGIDYRLSKPYPFKHKEEYIAHSTGVAKAAEQIAMHTTDLDPEKAYVLGLLHDYGKRICQFAENRFHGREGFDEMKKLGYDDVARICLTHTFNKSEFDISLYPFYPQEDIFLAKNYLKNIIYDDYDLLICLCDKFFEAFDMVSIEYRVKRIFERCNLTPKVREVLLSESNSLKDHFDKKTGKDIYKILGIKDDTKI